MKTPGSQGPNAQRSETAAKITSLNKAYQSALEAKDHPALVRIAQEIVDLQPDDPWAFRRLSSAHIHSGSLDQALTAAIAAHEKDPDAPGHRLHLGGLLNRLQKSEAAIEVLEPCVGQSEKSVEILTQLSFAYAATGNVAQAIQTAADAMTLEPGKPVRLIVLSNLLLRFDKPEAVIALIQDFTAEYGSSAQINRLLCISYLRVGEVDAAVAAIDAALEQEPEAASLRQLRIHVLVQADKIETAKQAAYELLEHDSSNLQVRRQLISALIKGNENEEALRQGAHLLALAPDVKEYAECMQFILEKKQKSSILPSDVNIADLKQGARDRQYLKPRTFRQKLGSKLSILLALILREIVTRHGRNRLGFFWSVLEPLVHIGVLAVIFAVSMRSNPPLGENYFLFYFTGVVPFLLLSHITQRGGNGVIGARNMLQLSAIAPLDILVSKAIVELFITSLVVLIFTMLFWTLGIQGMPSDPILVLNAFLLTFVFGLGLSGIFATFLEFGRLVEAISTAVFRAIYLTSGIFFLPNMVPEQLRNILYWNPLVHIIDLSRQGYYPFYEGADTDLTFVLISSTLTLAVGMGMVFAVTPIMRATK